MARPVVSANLEGGHWRGGGVLDGPGTQMLARGFVAPQYVQRCKNIDHDAGQFAFFDFCVGNRHQVLARAHVKAVHISPKLWIARVEVVKVPQLKEFSSKWGTNYTYIPRALQRCSLECRSFSIL